MNKMLIISKTHSKELFVTACSTRFCLFAFSLVMMTVAVGQLSYAEQFR